MDISPVQNLNINPNLKFTHKNKHQVIKPHQADLNHKKNNLKVRLGVFATTLLGVASALAIISKRQGFSLNPKKIFSQRPRDWAIFKIHNKKRPNDKELDFKEGEILLMAAGSVAGGLCGGFLFDDKKNRKAKIKESVNQMLGDVAIPLSFVALPTRAYKKFEKLPQLNTKHIKLKSFSEFVQNNRFLRILCPVAVSGVSLGSGIIAGNRVSNLINEKVHGEKVERKIKVTDFAPHLDDVCLAVSLMAEKSPVASIISRFVPAALSIAGNEAGNAKAHHHKPHD